MLCLFIFGKYGRQFAQFTARRLARGPMNRADALNNHKAIGRDLAARVNDQAQIDGTSTHFF